MTANTLKACRERPSDWHLMIRQPIIPPDREEAPCVGSSVAFEGHRSALGSATGIRCEYCDGEVKGQVAQNELVIK